MKFDLVFEGGGAKGFVFVGAMQEFEARGHSYDRLLGTSAGAITAVLLAAGYSASEMLAAMAERVNGKSTFAGFLGLPKEFSEEELATSQFRQWLHDVDLPLVPEFLEASADQQLLAALLKQPTFRHLFSFVERGGWFASDAFVTWLQQKLDSGTFQGKPRQFSKLTLKQFFAATQREFSVIAANSSRGRMLVLNHHTAPDCPVVMAVRMSMSIPLIWQEVIWQKEWGLYQQKDITGHRIVDGGLVSNFPISLFVSDDPIVIGLMGEKRGAELIGVLIDDLTSVPNIPPLPPARGFDWSKLESYNRLMRLMYTAMAAHDNLVVDAFLHTVAKLPAKEVGVTEFDMSEARRAALINSGRAAMAAHLATRLEPPPPGVARAVEPPEVSAARRSADRVAKSILEP